MALRPTAKEFVPGTSPTTKKPKKTKLSAKASAFVPKTSPSPIVPASPKFEVNGVSPKVKKDDTVNGFLDEEDVNVEPPKEENVAKPPVKDRLRASGPILPRNSKPITITNTIEKEPLKLSIPKKKRSESFEEAESGAEKALESSVRRYTRDEIMSLRRKGVSAREKEIVTAISTVLGKNAAAPSASNSPRTYSPAEVGRRLGRGGKRDGRGRGGSTRNDRTGGGRGRGYEEMDIGEVKDLDKSENRYVVKKVIPPDEKLIRDMTATLNKLTPEKFEKLLEQVEAMKIDTPERLRDTVHAVFEKALAEPAFSPIYAEFSVSLSTKLQRFDDEQEAISFKRLLLNKCQQEFEKEGPRTPTGSESPTPGDSDTEPREETLAKSKRRMLATIQFIGELYARKLLNTAIMKQCIDVLLGKTESPEEEKLEALCKLLSTIGKTIDVPKNNDVVTGPFATLKVLSKKKDLSSRLRFMIQDILDLRNDKWVDRRAKTVGQKKLSEIHKDDGRKDSPKPSVSRTPRGGNSYIPSPRTRGGGTPARTPKGTSPTGDDDTWEVAGSNTRKGRKTDQFVSPRRSQFSSPKPVSRTGASPRIPSRSENSKKDKNNSSRAVAPGDRNKVSAGTLNSFSVLDGDENENETEQTPSSDRASPEDDVEDSEEPAPTPTSERKRLNLKKPSSNRVFFPEGGNKARASGSKDNEVLDREKAESRIKGILEEYLISEDAQEACLCANEIAAKLPKDDSDVGLHLLISQGLGLAAEKKPKDRTLLTSLFVQLHEEKILSKDDFATGFKDTLEIAEDIMIDFPKLFDFLASVFAKLVIVDALSLAYLSTDATKPLQDEDKEKLTILVLKAINNEASDKLVSLYTESGLELSSVVTSADLDTLLKDQGLSALIGVAS